MNIHIPNSAFLGNLDPFLRSYNPANKEVLEVSSHEKWISFHPVVLCMLAVLGLSAKKVEFNRLQAKSKHYLERMGLFKVLRIDSSMNITEHEPSGRFIPLTSVRNSKELSEFMKDMIPLLHLEPGQVEPLKYVISELVRNVLEHSRSSNGALVCAQYYGKSHKVRIGIVDDGVGIRKSINQSHEAETDSEAIRLALTPGITGTTQAEGGTELNAGAGLFFIKSIAKANGDFFVMYSGSCMYKLLKSSKLILYADPFLDKHSISSDYPYWQGTVVGLDITLRRDGNFSQLLDLMSRIYAQAIRERKREKYREVRFV